MYDLTAGYSLLTATVFFIFSKYPSALIFELLLNRPLESEFLGTRFPLDGQCQKLRFFLENEAVIYHHFEAPSNLNVSRVFSFDTIGFEMTEAILSNDKAEIRTCFSSDEWDGIE